MSSRRKIKGQDPLVPTGRIIVNIASTTALVGPSSYFQKSKSTVSLNRVPYDSKIKNEPAISFAKGPKSLANYKTSVDETYDLKTYRMYR